MDNLESGVSKHIDSAAFEREYVGGSLLHSLFDGVHMQVFTNEK